jgi:photosystem II stability/assembly factor-like uncharacterized protein
MFALLFSLALDCLGCKGATQTVIRDPPDWENISQIQSASAVGPDSIFVVTQRGDLVRVSNKGQLHRLGQLGLVDVVGFIGSHGLAVDRESRVWSSSDAGDSWQQVFTPKAQTFLRPQQLILTDELNGWVVGISAVWRTTDGGRNWQQMFSISNATDERIGRLYRGAFISSNTGWITSSGGAVVHTDDGGVTWKAFTPVSGQTDLHDIFFSDSARGWLIGRPHGGIYSTEDGGTTWQDKLLTPEGTYLNSIEFVNRNEGWAVGWSFKDKDREALVLHSFDGGEKWMRVAVKLNERFFDRICFYDRSHGWLIARDAIYYTDDAGENFRMVLRLPPIEKSSN